MSKPQRTSKQSDPKPNKKLKKTQTETINCKYLFRNQTPHTKLFSGPDLNLKDSKLNENVEVLSMNVPSADLPPIVPDRSCEELFEILNNHLPKSMRRNCAKVNLENQPMEEEKAIHVPQNKFKSKESLAILLKEERFSYREICKALNLKEQEAKYIIKKYREGKDPNEPKKIHALKLTNEMEEEVEKFLQKPENAVSTLEKMRQHIEKETKTTISSSCVSSLLDCAGYSRKRVARQYVPRNTLRTINLRFEVARKFIEYLFLETTFVFIDECSFNQNLCPLYAYSKKDCRGIVVTKPNGPNYSLIAAMTPNSILGFQIFKGGVKQNDFGSFIIRLVEVLRKSGYDKTDYVFFLDNAPIHRGKIIGPFLKKFCILYNAPYSPFLNPIEELFGEWKKCFRSKVFDDKISVVERILLSYAELNVENICKYYYHSLKYLYSCLELKAIH